MRDVLRKALVAGITVVACGCAASPPPAVVEPTLSEAEPAPVEEITPEPIVVAEPEPGRDPDPPLSDRWRAPFAVSSSGRPMTRSPRSVTVLGSDSAIAAGLAAVNGTPPPGRAASNGAVSSSAANSNAANGNAANSNAARSVAVAGPPTSSASTTGPAPESATPSTAPPGPTRASTNPGASVSGQARGPAASPPVASNSGNASPPGTSTRAGAGAILIGDPIGPEPAPVSAPRTGAGGAGAPATTTNATRAAGSGPPQPTSRPGPSEDDRPGTPVRSVPGPSSRERTYTVESGDSWIGIARDHGVSFSQLQEANPGVNPERIRIGQVLQIPPSPRAAAERTHRVGNGDTLSGIAARYGVSVRSIRDANELTSDIIRQGQVLTIPAE